MSRILFRRITTAAALAVLLTLAAPAHAVGWNGWASDGNPLQSAWQWVASFWAPQAPAHDSRRITKAGIGIDPNGQAQSDRGTGIDPDGLKSDGGLGVDPNG
ncbi:MAG TPA: hypothetical protein VLB76_16985 [Thermoanaerobaculia bacterium]|jgi:hypothetical protein|nr:hypothetical protein [Thermoanaerobaculia bacterium]